MSWGSLHIIEYMSGLQVGVTQIPMPYNPSQPRGP